MGLKVRLRGGFSDRNAIKKENTDMQLTALDERTRTQLCNFIDMLFSFWLKVFSYDKQQYFLKMIIKDVYVQEVKFNESYNSNIVLDAIKETIRENDYDEVLTVIEYITKKIEKLISESGKKVNEIRDCLNDILQKEYVGYRYVNKKIVPITNDSEIKEIDQAANTEFSKVNAFINKAINLLSDRNNPDYKNSIKESISAVEEMCNTILGEAGTLGASLKKLEDTGVKIHPSLKTAFEKLYGYTSDESGIRHAGRIDGKNATFAEAKFMLVVCSAFVNYLIDNLNN